MPEEAMRAAPATAGAALLQAVPGGLIAGPAGTTASARTAERPAGHPRPIRARLSGT
jgi:hypothetical protein